MNAIAYPRLARSQLRGFAMVKLRAQGGVCPICGNPIDLSKKGEAVVDHDHHTGRIRGVLHRSCNGMEGKVANAVGRWGGVGMHYPSIIDRMKRLVAYLEAEPLPLIYPFHKTEAELRLEASKKARIARARRKAAQAVGSPK